MIASVHSTHSIGLITGRHRITDTNCLLTLEHNIATLLAALSLHRPDVFIIQKPYLAIFCNGLLQKRASEQKWAQAIPIVPCISEYTMPQSESGTLGGMGFGTCSTTACCGPDAWNVTSSLLLVHVIGQFPPPSTPVSMSGTWNMNL